MGTRLIENKGMRRVQLDTSYLTRILSLSDPLNKQYQYNQLDKQHNEQSSTPQDLTSSSQAMLCNIHYCVFASIISYQTPRLVPNHFNFMHQVKKFGAEILFIPYFSPFGPPSHSPSLLVSALTVTFLLEHLERNESSSSSNR